MSSTWVLSTQNDPLVAVRRFLYELQHRAGLEGFVLPMYQKDARSIKPGLADQPSKLASADPFAPIVAANAAKLIEQVSRERPGSHFGAVLRSCEARALQKMTRDGRFQPEGWVIIGVDCMASFPAEDFGWRVDKAGSIQGLTREALRFARQGGIASYRFRRSCQMCPAPVSEEVDLSLHLYGLPVNKFILVVAKDETAARRLQLDEITSKPASPELIQQYEKILLTLTQRKDKLRKRAMAALPEDLPAEADSLIELLANCAPCQRCLEACPIYAGELEMYRNGGPVLREEVRTWLADCLACGMCEEACPNHLPLTAIKSRIALQLQ